MNADPMFLDPVFECIAGNAQQVARFYLVASGFAQGGFDKDFLVIIQIK